MSIKLVVSVRFKPFFFIESSVRNVWLHLVSYQWALQCLPSNRCATDDSNKGRVKARCFRRPRKVTKVKRLFPVSPQLAACPVLPILRSSWSQVTEEESSRCGDSV